MLRLLGLAILPGLGVGALIALIAIEPGALARLIGPDGVPPLSIEAFTGGDAERTVAALLVALVLLLALAALLQRLLTPSEEERRRALREDGRARGERD